MSGMLQLLIMLLLCTLCQNSIEDICMEYLQLFMSVQLGKYQRGRTKKAIESFEMWRYRIIMLRIGWMDRV